ncbi:hypothetical protein ILUMI_09550 [Ignelater luminosus]|uniref:Tc1-like transposase DDE domain-containing protein n=1 Tax=Ignelater luminosus TaxID=2038154 RepID=A0A8K0GEY4_IGNLU|nr:hypothetical protein ILUMI_09550 [Ignelater luminosus]
MDTWYLHHDAPAHHAKACTDYLSNTKLNLFEHPPFSPHLAPWLVPHSRMKRGRAGLRTGFGKWRSVLNVVEITLKEFNKQTCIAKLL